MLLRLVRAYSRCLETHPYSTQLLTSSTLWFSGDIISQKIEGAKEINWNRTSRMTLYGFCVAGPAFCWWYRFLEARTVHLMGAGLWRYIGTKLVLDQLVFEPTYLATFFVVSTVLEEKGPFSKYAPSFQERFRNFKLQSTTPQKDVPVLSDTSSTNNTTFDQSKSPHVDSSDVYDKVISKLKNEWWPTFKLDCQLWPTVQILNFRFLPVHFQAICVNTGNLILLGCLNHPQNDSNYRSFVFF